MFVLYNGKCDSAIFEQISEKKTCSDALPCGILIERKENERICRTLETVGTSGLYVD